MTSDVGIDWGRGACNVNKETGIRFGVIPVNDLDPDFWNEGANADYGWPTCGKCGGDVVDLSKPDALPFDLENLKTVRQEGRFSKHAVLGIPVEHRGECGGHKEWHDEGREYACLACARSFDRAYASGARPFGYDLDDGEYRAHLGGGDSDVCVLKSPYYTHAQFCGQCSPGAGNLRTPVEGGPRTYCFGPDCFRPNGDEEITGEYNGKKTSCLYPVYRVADDELVFQPQHLNEED